ncbi:hypothetical protein NPIL_507081 [Nephila pilipes]|uniref:Uncharacterized protein n=1 Tax=Nephila pilipes TaxID=299642 RepID=A0A8X6NKJ6_NEPPI|nr:hypothetical protein NPIL_507081 [Nephila pilipes]
MAHFFRACSGANFSLEIISDGVPSLYLSRDARGGGQRGGGGKKKSPWQKKWKEGRKKMASVAKHRPRPMEDAPKLFNNSREHSGVNLNYDIPFSYDQ